MMYTLGNVKEEYTIFILGDVTGSGDVGVSDVEKAYQKKEFDGSSL